MKQMVSAGSTEESPLTIEGALENLLSSLCEVHRKLYGPQVSEEKDIKPPHLTDRLYQKIGECSSLVGGISEAVDQIGE